MGSDSQESKQSFFEKKDQKAFAPSPALALARVPQAYASAEQEMPLGRRWSKSFLLLFLEKEGLTSSLTVNVQAAWYKAFFSEEKKQKTFTSGRSTAAAIA